MEPLLNSTLGDLSPAPRRRADHRLSGRFRDPPGRSSPAPSDGLGELVRDRRYRDAPGYPGRGPAYTLDRYRTANDRAVEAMLASIREPCTASQLASGLEWTLPRTIDALEHLEAALANTGQILTRIIGHSYMLSPRPGLLHHREIARCLRHTRDRLDLPAAAVLHRALTCSREDRARDALSNPAEHAAAQRLIAASLLEDDHGVLRPTPLADATFRAAPEPRYLRWTA
jgi:hypothetical protein